MILKPGWIIALMMFWVVVQILIIIGDTSLSLVTLDQTPIVRILTAAQEMNTITGIFNPANWSEVLTNIWKIFTFQANFLSGAWSIVSVFFTCIYAGLGLSLLYTFFTK
jgi:hypothetical protein